MHLTGWGTVWMKFNASDGVVYGGGIKTVFKFNASDGVGHGVDVVQCI